MIVISGEVWTIRVLFESRAKEFRWSTESRRESVGVLCRCCGVELRTGRKVLEVAKLSFGEDRRVDTTVLEFGEFLTSCIVGVENAVLVDQE